MSRAALPIWTGSSGAYPMISRRRRLRMAAYAKIRAIPTIKAVSSWALTPNETDEYAVGFNHQSGRKDTPPYAGKDRTASIRYWRWPYWDKESVFFLSRTQFAEDHTIKLRAYHDTFENSLVSFDDATYSTMLRPYAFNSQYDDYTFGAGFEYDTTWFDRHEIKLGFNYKQDVHREIGDIDQPRQRFADEYYSYAIEDSYTPIDALRFVAGASYDQQKRLQTQDLINNQIVSFPLGETKDAYNIQGSAFYELLEDFTVHASLAHKTRFPTIKDRYSYSFGSALPSPDLQAEKALNYELGMDGRAFGLLDYGAAVFFSQIDSTIESVILPSSSCTRPPCFQLQNIGEQENLGIELYATAEINEQWRMHFNYTWLDRNNITNPEIKPLDTIRHKVFAYLEYQPFRYLRLLASAEYNSERFSNTPGTRIASEIVPDFVIGNLKATLPVHENLSAELGVNNVADQNYAYMAGFPEPGRNYFANLTMRY